MGRVGEQLSIDFVISTGDNFYENGLTGTDDEAFEQSFTDIYTAKSLQKPWYLGNKLAFFPCCYDTKRHAFL
jgi:tartrate-resistant acid phosphatase type 5